MQTAYFHLGVNTMNKRTNNCKDCTKRYFACQDVCPDKSPGNNYPNKDKEFYAYKAEKDIRFNKRKSRRH